MPSAVKPVGVCTRASTSTPPCSAQVLGLVAERVDVRARVLGHHQQRRGARARLAQRPRSWRRCSLQQHARLVRRRHRRAGVARLLEVVGARAAQRVDELRHSTAELPPVRLGQELQRGDREHVAEHAEGDRAAEPDGRREEADDAREQRADPAADVVTEAPAGARAPASGTARPGRSRSPRSSPRRRSRAGSRRSAASCWSRSAPRSTRPASARQRREQRERLAAPEPVVHEARAQVAEERAGDDHEQVARVPTTVRSRSFLR